MSESLRFADLAATLTRIFANASTQLARMKASDRLWRAPVVWVYPG